MAGFIKLHRGWGDGTFFEKKEAYCNRAAWVWLLEKAAWKDTERRDPYGSIVTLKRGQLHTSCRTLGGVFGWSKNRAERFLRDLEKCRMVDRQTDRAGVFLTICNYEKYQGERTTDGPQSGTPADHGRTTQEEYKEIKEDKNTPQSPPRGVVKPDDVSDDVWNAFKRHRAKHGGISDLVVAGFRREAGKAGWSLESAMEESIVQGWRGFKAHYVKEKSNDRQKPTGTRTAAQRALSIVEGRGD